ncbi:MAG TPA: transglycosylase SLT domain-containing protein, partial [Gemmatimonadales bacterium]|nr:transglycosylase SLT domain-containing protein [Gemmatimonadales bacterium]
LIAGQSGSAEARAAAEVLTVAGAPLSPHAMLVVARSLARSGPLPRAADFFRTALAAGVGTAEDRFAYANVLARLGRHAEAAKAFGAVRGDRSLAGRAAYLRVRSLVRGGLIANPRGELRRIVRRHPGDTAAAASALYLIADLAVDRGQDAEARATLRELARRYPTSPLAPEAGFRAAIIAYVEGRTAVAARELDSLRQRYPRSDEALAAAYWSGRAWHAAGDTARARARWESVAETAPLSYYAAASARRLGRPPWAPAPAEDRFPEVPAVEEGMARVRLLDSLGLDAESALEREALFTGADEDLDRLLATARAFREYGEVSRAVQLGWRALAAGAAPDARVYRLIYPIWHLDGILAEAGEAGLDPALVAALIRQESRFTPWATSRAGARGLMQLMPEVGRALAGRLEFPVWDEALLYVPDVSVELGTRQLATLARRYGEPERYLAAYNAGGSRVDRWVERAGTSDPELFVERIPYRETRDYVRVITRQRELYRALYQPLATASPGGD